MRAGLRTSLLLTIPFVLLLNADQVVVSTHMYGDLSGTRRVTASGDNSLAREIRKWARQTTRGFDDAGAHLTGDNVMVANCAGSTLSMTNRRGPRRWPTGMRL